MTLHSTIQIETQLCEMAIRYNAVMMAKKIRPRHAAAEETHKLLCIVIKKLGSSLADESEFTARAVAMLMDVRWARPTLQFKV